MNKRSFQFTMEPKPGASRRTATGKKLLTAGQTAVKKGKPARPEDVIPFQNDGFRDF